MSATTESNPLKQQEIYLDNNATTPVLACAAAAVLHHMQTCFGNPSSSHSTGLKAKVELEATRALARKVIGASSGQIVFTSGATEGIQTSIVSALLDARSRGLTGPEVLLLYGATEHKAVPESLKHWNQVLQLGATVMAIPVDQHGLLDQAFIRQKLPAAALICTMAANNETGVKQDLATLDLLIRSVNPTVRWMVDCVQALGKMSLDIANTSIDYAPFSGHKLYAPKGIGFLYVRSGSPYRPFIAGGGQESGLRSGTENLPGIAALHAIFTELNKTTDSVFQSEALLWQHRQQLLDALRQVFPALVLNSQQPYIVPTTLNFSVPGFYSKDIMDLFDAAGIRVSSGSACSSKVPTSFVLDAMGLDTWRSQGAIRLSFGPAMTVEECQQACTAIRRLSRIVQQCCLVLSDVEPLADLAIGGLTQLKHEDMCSYLLVCEQSRRAVIIDPVPALANRLANMVQGHQLNLIAVLDSHLHQDHRSARVDLMTLLSQQTQAVDALGWPVNEVQLSLGQYQLKQLATPGHSAESRSYLLYQQQQLVAAFVGDLLLPGGTGRLDLADSDPLAFCQSLTQLQRYVAADTVLLSSHDYAQRFFTSWRLACQEQPLLAELIEQQQPPSAWLNQLQQQNAALAAQNQYSCGIVEVCWSDAKAVIETSALAAFLQAKPQTVLVDVREPYEQSAGMLQQFIPTGCTVLQLPLTRLCDALMSGALTQAQPLLLVCRSGNRSLVAAKVLNRAGFSEIYNLKGGIAMLN
jgi:cysteine sulfinate desulfinase/cysteine desulfurase-like protein/glyoxylase-like metal-dependent hydrolase (beta-lactamase superfamily II)/rhodanese-related sulfurtransferase